jgi:REP-associated tyrosine transposase
MSGYDSKKHHRRSIRLKGYDYSRPGAYFLTMCVQDWEWKFGRVVNGKMQFSPAGEIAHRCWEEIPEHFKNAILDKFIIMPNHMHGIVILKSQEEESSSVGVGVEYIQPRHNNLETQIERQNRYQHVIPNSISSILRSYKAAVTRLCRESGMFDFRWQRNYYEHIVRNYRALYAIRAYIRNNPAKWTMDHDAWTS